MLKKRSLLLYADDPGAVNYLAPLVPALSSAGFSVDFVVAPALVDYVVDRQIVCQVRDTCLLPNEMIDTSDALVVGTSEDPHCFGHMLVAAARDKGIQSLAVVDMEVNAASRFRGESENSLQHAPNFLAVPDIFCRDAYVKLGFAADNILVCGHPHYDFIRGRREKFLTQDRQALRLSVFPDAPVDRPIWIFLVEGVDKLNPSVSYRSPDYTMSGRGVSNFRAVIILEEILHVAAALHPKPYVVLRLHPKSLVEDFEPYVNEMGEISRGGDPLPLVWAADLVLGMTTMLLLEAYLLRRPHVSVLPKIDERDWLVTTKMGLTPVAVTRDDLSALINMVSKFSEIKPHLNENSVLPSNAAHHLAKWIKTKLVRLPN